MSCGCCVARRRLLPSTSTRLNDGRWRARALSTASVRRRLSCAKSWRATGASTCRSPWALVTVCTTPWPRTVAVDILKHLIHPGLHPTGTTAPRCLFVIGAVAGRVLCCRRGRSPHSGRAVDTLGAAWCALYLAIVLGWRVKTRWLSLSLVHSALSLCVSLHSHSVSLARGGARWNQVQRVSAACALCFHFLFTARD